MTTPVITDIPLPLPAPEPLLQFLVVFSFILHILFVNLMVGGSILTVIFEWRGKKNKDYDALAREISKTITVNKSMAVVLGVAPLLCLSVLYSPFLYGANALTGGGWIMVIPLVTLTFLLLYTHKYSWDVLKDQKNLHIGLGILPVVLFLLIPFIFLANINLMLFPDMWTQVKGFLSSLALPNVLPRYFHFLAASVSVTALFLVYYFGRKSFPLETLAPSLSRGEVKRQFYGVAFALSLAQFVVGPLVLFTLPSHGLSYGMTLLIFLGATFGLIATWFLFKEVSGPLESVGRHFKLIVTLFTLTVCFMATGRHTYRETALAEPRRQMRLATQARQDAGVQAAYDLKSGRANASPEKLGEQTFNTYCSACHAPDKQLVGPALKEIAQIYKGNAAGIVKWALAPGKKRAGPAMPSMAMVGEDNLKAVAAYMLKF